MSYLKWQRVGGDSGRVSEPGIAGWWGVKAAMEGHVPPLFCQLSLARAGTLTRFQSAVTNITLKWEVVGKERKGRVGADSGGERKNLERERRWGCLLNTRYVANPHPFLAALL